MMFFGEELTVARVVAAYASISESPIQDCWYQGAFCDGLSAVLLSQRRVSLVWSLEMSTFEEALDILAEASGASVRDLRDFVRGFENVYCRDLSVAYKLGLATWKEVWNDES